MFLEQVTTSLQTVKFHFGGYVNKLSCRIWDVENPMTPSVYGQAGSLELTIALLREKFTDRIISGKGDHNS